MLYTLHPIIYGMVNGFYRVCMCCALYISEHTIMSSPSSCPSATQWS